MSGAISTSKTVQFFSADQVIAGYVARDCPAFAVFAGKQFLFKYEGDSIEEGGQLLAGYLDLLKDSSGIYTLAVYEDSNIKSNTPYDGSFNFRFHMEPYYQRMGTAGGSSVDARLEKLEKLILEMAADREPVDNGLGAIGEVLNNPAVQQLIPLILPKILGLFGLGDPTPPPAIPMQKIAGVPDPDTIIAESVEVLKRHVDISDVLHWLAVMATTNPVQFKMIVAAMEAFRK